MITIEPYLEFYITNVCNLACNGCNRFNNYKFKGHQTWADHEAEYAKWAKRITAPFITIIGGEPTLNPDLENFAAGIRKLWPDSEVMIQTNGTYQRPQHIKFWQKYKVGYGVSLHDPKTADGIKDSWKNFGGTFDAYEFHQAALIEEDGKFTLHNSIPQKAFEVCDMKWDRTMYNGKLYKCPTMATLPEFRKQFDVAMGGEDEAILNSYKPLTADCSEEELQAFYEDRDKAILQCKFCPANLHYFKPL